MNITLFTGAILGLLSVVMGAFFDHALKMRISTHMIDSVTTAIRYHQLYALLVTIIGLTMFLSISKLVADRLVLTAWVFILGVLLFSFSIYLAAITGIVSMLRLAPIGGIFFMTGWIMLAWIGISSKREN